MSSKNVQNDVLKQQEFLDQLPLTPYGKLIMLEELGFKPTDQKAHDKLKKQLKREEINYQFIDLNRCLESKLKGDNKQDS